MTTALSQSPAIFAQLRSLPAAASASAGETLCASGQDLSAAIRRAIPLVPVAAPKVARRVQQQRRRLASLIIPLPHLGRRAG